VDLGHLPGERRRVRRGGFASREAARAALRRAQSIEAAETDPAVRTVAEWLQCWLSSRTRLRPRTRVGYAEHIDRYLNPYLGGLLLEELTPKLVQEAFDAISRHSTAGGVLLSLMTVQRVRATLRAALNAAVRERLLSSNPAQGLWLEPGAGARPVVWTDQAVVEWTHSAVRPVVAVWTVEQTRQFLDFVSGHRLYALFHLVVMTGLRRGEVVGLRWEDIDLVKGTVRVARQLQAGRGGLVELAPKSAASRRMLALTTPSRGCCAATSGDNRRHRHAGRSGIRAGMCSLGGGEACWPLSGCPASSGS
jgi:integrase